MSRKIVILRQPEDSAEMADAVRAAGFEPLVEPVLDIVHLAADYSGIDEQTPLIFTSAHGVQALAAACDGRANPVFAVGRNTADAAELAGFTKIETAAGTVEDLAELLSSPTYKTLISPIYVRAEHVSRDLKEILVKNGLKIHEFVNYKAVPAQNLSLSLLQGLDRREINAVAFFSGRGAEVFAGLVEQYGRTVRLKPVKALCISEHVVQSVSVLPFHQALLAETPDRYGMIKLVESLSVTKE